MARRAGMRLSVVVPCYHSERSLPELVERVARVLRDCCEAFEVILVNDGSRDGTWATIEMLSRSHPYVVGMNLMRNYGQHNALLCGIRKARFERVATLDDDLQHPPEALPQLLAKLEEGYDVVYGTPAHEPHGLLRGLASRLTKLALQSAMGAETARHASALRVFRTPLRDAFANYRSSFVSIDVLLTWGSTRFSWCEVEHAPRTYGHSQYTLRKLVVHAMNMMTGFSTLPLQVASWMGFSLTVFGICILAWVIGRYLYDGGSVPGFPFLAAIIAIFSGAQLFSLGIIGEYLARMHFRMMDRPAYAVRATLEHDPFGATPLPTAPAATKETESSWTSPASKA